MDLPKFIFLSCVWAFLFYNLRIYCADGRYAYAKILCDFRDKVSNLIEKGLKLTEHLDQEEGKATPDDIESIILIAGLTGVLDELTAEMVFIRKFPFIYIRNPEKRLRRRYERYLEILNAAHEKFLGKIA